MQRDYDFNDFSESSDDTQNHNPELLGAKRRGRPKLAGLSLFIFGHELIAGQAKVTFVKEDAPNNPYKAAEALADPTVGQSSCEKYTFKLANSAKEVENCMNAVQLRQP